MEDHTPLYRDADYLAGPMALEPYLRRGLLGEFDSSHVYEFEVLFK